jgi:hypothetical protein
MVQFGAKDIAERILRPGEGLQAAMDRVKNWTVEGLLETSEDKNPGRGRARQYSAESLATAILMEALSVRLGMPARDVKNRFPLIILKRALLDPNTKMPFVLLGMLEARQQVYMRAPLSASELAKAIREAPHDVYVILDLSLLSKKLVLEA